MMAVVAGFALLSKDYEIEFYVYAGQTARIDKLSQSFAQLGGGSRL